MRNPERPVRVTVVLPGALHIAVKVEAIRQGMHMRELLLKCVEEYFINHRFRED